MGVPEGNILSKKITAAILNIELVGDLDPHHQVSTGGLIAPGTTPKLKIYNQATLSQKIQYWLLVAVSIGSLISYGATVLLSIGIVNPQRNCNASSTALTK